MRGISSFCWLRGPTFWACLGAAACGPAPEVESAQTESGSSSGSTGPTAPPMTTAPPATTGTTTTGTTATPEPGTNSSSSDDGGFVAEPDVGAPMGAGLGEQCGSGKECESGSCFLFPGGDFGLCSECEVDADCMSDGDPGTCGFGDSAWAVCTDGSAGAICMEDDACQPGLVCVETLGTFSQCSECEADEDCEEPAPFCVTTFDIGRACVGAGDVENGGLCELGVDEVCASGFCTEVEFMGAPGGIALCGECASDKDCDKGETCTPATATMMSLDPAVCE